MGIILQLKHLSKTHKMKAFLLIFGLVAKEALGIDFVDNKKITVDTRAPSTYQNCNCQCNSDTWTDGNEIKGNCRSRDRNGALFCYVSGSALRSCRDIQQSSFLPDNNGRLKYYSYEACVTPPRNQCGNNYFFGGNQNFGDGDINYQSGFGFGGSNNYYPNRPFGGSNNYRPYGNSNNFNSNRPFGGSSSFNQNRPSLGNILGGFRKSGGSSDAGSSRGSVRDD